MNEINPHDKRNARIAWIVGLTIIALLWFCAYPRAEIYQCRDVNGCRATINDDLGNQKSVQFRKGDVVSTDAGWVVSTDDGWYRLRSRRGSYTPHRGNPWYTWWCWWETCSTHPFLLVLCGWYPDGWTLIECNRPACRAVKWEDGIVRLEYGESLDPSRGYTPLFLRDNEWNWYAGW